MRPRAIGEGHAEARDGYGGEICTQDRTCGDSEPDRLRQVRAGQAGRRTRPPQERFRPPSPRDVEFQTAEVVIPNPARDADQLPLSFRDGVFDNQQLDRQKMNRLIWGDNLLAMQALLSQGYEGKIDLIYIDPPFDSKADYSHQLHVGDRDINKGTIDHRATRVS